MRIALGIAALLGALVLVYWGLLFVGQRALIFPAPSLADAPARPDDAEVVWLDTPGGAVEAWYLPPLARDGEKAPLLIFAHGNGELIDYWPGEFAEPRSWGMGALLVEFPGYGRSKGTPSERSVEAAILAAHDWAAARSDVDSRRIVAYGRSLGGGAAAILATSRPVAALVLESSFTSVAAFARQFGAPALLVRDRFDNLAAVREFRGPILILHGEYDTIIPVSHARSLHAAQPAAELVIVPWGHNDMPRLWSLLESFLRRHAILAPAPG